MEKKVAILAWQKDHQIPGKIHSLLTAAPSSDGDWCIRNEQHGNQMRLGILGPSDQLAPPEVVEQLFEYLIQEHMYYMRKAMIQMWVRSTAPGEYALLLQANLRGAGTGHALKVFEQYLQRNRPEVVALHRVESKPWFPFRTDQPPRSMKYDLKPIFGPEILPLGNTGHFFHILEWLPQVRHPFLAFPARLLDAINAKPEDKLLDLHCGSGFFGCEMHKSFSEVHCVDARGISKLSMLYNIRQRGIKNVQYHQETIDAEYLKNFFDKREGQWTVILNPSLGEALPNGVIRTIAEATPGRVIHISANLTVAEAEIRRWRRSGMMLRKIIPFDLNPTTNRIEIAMFFAPDREGVMKRGVVAPEAPEGSETSAVLTLPMARRRKLDPRNVVVPAVKLPRSAKPLKTAKPAKTGRTVNKPARPAKTAAPKFVQKGSAKPSEKPRKRG